MSGKPWSAERKASFAAMVRKRWRTGVYARRLIAQIADAERQARAERMRALNRRMQHDEQLKAKCVRGQRKVRRSPDYRAIQSALMKDIMARPELRQRARFHCVRINKNPKVRRRQWAGRRRKQKARTDDHHL